MHTAGFRTPVQLAATQLWRVLKEFHVGEFVKAEWKKRHLNMESVARAAGYTAANIRGMFERVHVNDTTLARLSAASGVDFLALVKAERARLGGYEELSMVTAVREPSPPSINKSPVFACFPLVTRRSPAKDIRMAMVSGEAGRVHCALLLSAPHRSSAVRVVRIAESYALCRFAVFLSFNRSQRFFARS